MTRAPVAAEPPVLDRATRRRSLPRLLLAEIRPHQWVKNLFVLAPLLFGRKLGDVAAVEHAFTAFAAFCLMASSVYVLNDVLDAAADRSHPEKRRRPVASGELSVPAALVLFAVLFVTAFAVAGTLGWMFVFLISCYFVLTLAYSTILKEVPILDGIAIAVGFVLRVVAGAEAVDVVPSHWLIVCAFLLALYLAFAKRRQELLLLTDTARDHRRVLRTYTVDYLDQVNNIVLGATLVAYALYTVAPDTIDRFGTNRLIYGCVFVVYGLLRYMALLADPTKGGNPSKLLVRDRPLLLAVLLWALYNASVIYQPQLLSAWRSLVS